MKDVQALTRAMQTPLYRLFVTVPLKDHFAADEAGYLVIY